FRHRSPSRVISPLLLRAPFSFSSSTPTSDSLTLSLHDALPISAQSAPPGLCRISLRPPPVPAHKRHSLWRTAPSPRCRRKDPPRSEEHTSELQSRFDLVCRLLLEKKKIKEE